MVYRSFLVATSVALILQGTASATVIRETELGPYGMIRPVSAVVIHGDRRTPGAPALYNGDGLDHANPLFASYGSDPDTLGLYEIEEPEYPVSIEFDLGANYLLGEMWVWQPKLPGEFDRGIDEFDVVLKDAQGQEVGVIRNGSQQIKRTGLQPVARFSAFGECLVVPVPDCVRYVELRIVSNLRDPQYVGLAEVAFGGRAKPDHVPEPSSLAATLMGSMLLIVRRATCRKRTACG